MFLCYLWYIVILLLSLLLLRLWSRNEPWKTLCLFGKDTSQDLKFSLLLLKILLYYRRSPKAVSPILWCWTTVSELDVGDMAVETEPSHQYSITFCCYGTDGSRGAVRQNGIRHGVCMKRRCGTEFMHAEKNAPSSIHQHLMDTYGDQTVVL